MFFTSTVPQNGSLEVPRAWKLEHPKEFYFNHLQKSLKPLARSSTPREERIILAKGLGYHMDDH